MNVSKKTLLLLLIIIGFSVAVKTPQCDLWGAYAEEPDFVLVERGKNFERYQNQLNLSQFAFKTAPEWIWNGSCYVPYVFKINTTEQYYEVRTSSIGARLHKGRVEYYKPDMSMMEVGRENFVVFKWSNVQGKFVAACASLNTFWVNSSYLLSEEAMNVTTCWESSAGTLKIIYQFDIGLKHSVQWFPNSAGIYAVVQGWAEITYDKCRLDNATILRRNDNYTIGKADSLTFLFYNDSQPFGIFENQATSQDLLHKTVFCKGTVTYQGITVTDAVAWVFYNSTLCDLEVGESLTIDPDTMTTYPTLDGYIEYMNGAYNSVSTGLAYLFAGEYYVVATENAYAYRSFLRFNVTDIPNTYTVTSATFYCYYYAKSSSGVEGVCDLDEVTDIGATLDSSDWSSAVLQSYGQFVGRVTTYQYYSMNVLNSITPTDTMVTFRLKGTVENYDEDYWRWSFYSVERTGTSQDPYLYVEYSLPSGYNLNLKVMDWDLTDAIQSAIVYKDSDALTSNAQGWANWTSVTGTVAVKVKYFGYWVNGTFSVVMDADKTISIQCKLYDVTVTAKPNNEIGVLSGVNVTAYNDTGTSNGKIKTGLTVDYTGQVTLSNLPNATLRVILRVKSDYSIIIANMTKTISSDGQTESIVGTENYATVTVLWTMVIVGFISSWCFKHKQSKKSGRR